MRIPHPPACRRAPAARDDRSLFREDCDSSPPALRASARNDRLLLAPGVPSSLFRLRSRAACATPRMLSHELLHAPRVHRFAPAAVLLEVRADDEAIRDAGERLEVVGRDSGADEDRKPAPTFDGVDVGLARLLTGGGPRDDD